MAPKSMSQAQKVEKFLNFFHESRTCHTLKDLESAVPVATKINKMQIKDLLKELTDTNQVKVEKIGSGNWYWAWPGEELSEQLSQLEKLQREESMLQAGIGKLGSQLNELQSKRALIRSPPEYDDYADQVATLESEIQTLSAERNGWEAAAADGIDSKRSAATEQKAQVALHADNLLVMEAYIHRQLPVSCEEMENIRRECYGSLYREGQDLSQIDE